MSPRHKKNLVAVTPGGDITKEDLAGYYLLYSFREEGVLLSRVRKAFREHGLDDTRLPKGRRPEHVMQQACTAAQRISQNGRKEEIRAQEVGRRDGVLTYQMTRHVHDLAHRVIEHPKALRVNYLFAKEALEFEPLDGVKKSEVQPLIDEIQTYFDANQSRLPGRGLRTLIRHYLEAAGAENVRDGVFFMPTTLKLFTGSALRDHHGDSIDSEWFIDALGKALADIYGDSTTLWQPVPCINDEGQREFLQRKFIENCDADLERFRDECLGLVQAKADGKRERSFRADVRTRLVDQRRVLNERREQFEAILGGTIAELDQNMSLADAALAKFLTEADA